MQIAKYIPDVIRIFKAIWDVFKDSGKKVIEKCIGSECPVPDDGEPKEKKGGWFRRFRRSRK